MSWIPERHLELTHIYIDPIHLHTHNVKRLPAESYCFMWKAGKHYLITFQFNRQSRGVGWGGVGCVGGRTTITDTWIERREPMGVCLQQGLLKAGKSKINDGGRGLLRKARLTLISGQSAVLFTRLWNTEPVTSCLYCPFYFFRWVKMKIKRKNSNRETNP